MAFRYWIICLFTGLFTRLAGQTVQITLVPQTLEDSIPSLSGFVQDKNQRQWPVQGTRFRLSADSLELPWTFYIQGYQPVTMRQIQGTHQRVMLLSEVHHIPEYTFSESIFPRDKRQSGREIQVLPAAYIAAHLPQTPAMALAQSGALFVQHSQMGGGSPVIRGFEASRILLVVDGVRMNNAIFRSGHLQNILRVDVNSLEQIEVLFGPGTAQHGSDALGGVVHLETVKPQLTGTKYLKGSFFTRFSSANQEKTTHGLFRYGRKNWAGVTSFTLSDFNDLRQGNSRSPFLPDQWKRDFFVIRRNGQDTLLSNPQPNLQLGSAYRQMDLVQKFAFRAGAWRHDLQYQMSTTSDVPRYDRLTMVDEQQIPVFAEWAYGPERRHLWMAQSQRETPKMQWRILGAWQWVEESRHVRRFQQLQRRSQNERVHVGEWRLDVLRKHLPAKGRPALSYRWRAGIDVQWNAVTSTARFTQIETGQTSAGPTRYPDGGSFQTLAGMYGEYQWALGKTSALSVSGRINYVGLDARFTDTSFFSFPFQTAGYQRVGGNGSIEWGKQFPSHPFWKSVHLVWATGFRAPNVDDIGKVFDSRPGQLIVPNPDIRPEYVYTLEGRTTMGNQDHQLSLSTYGTWIHGLLSLRPGQWQGQDSLVFDGLPSEVLSLQNLDQGWIIGTSARYKGQWSSYGFTRAQITYTYGRQFHQNQWFPLEHIPPVFGLISAGCTFPRWEIEGWLHFNGWKHAEDYGLFGEDNLDYATPLGTPAWYTLNLRMQWKPIEKVMLQCAVENLLDQNYRTFSSGISAPGRNVVIAVRGSF